MANKKSKWWLVNKKSMLVIPAVVVVVLLAVTGVRALFYARGVGEPRSYITTPILDNFNRPDENPINSVNWTKLDQAISHGGGSYNLAVVNNQATESSIGGGNTGMAVWNTAFAGDQEAYFRIPEPSGTYGASVMLNMSGTSGYKLTESNGTWSIYRLDNAAQTLLATSTGPTELAGDVLIGRHVGDKITFSYKRGNIETQILSANDATYSGNLIGVMITGPRYIDDFGGGSLHGSNLQIGNLEKDLVGHWKLDGNTKDSTPYSDNCTIPFGGVNLIADRKGQLNSAYSFTTAHYMQCPLNDVLKPANYVSVSAWVDPGGLANTINGIAGDAVTDGYGLYLDSSRIPYFQVGGVSLVGSSALNTGQWYFVAGTYDGATMRIYVNGSLVSSQAYTGSLSTISTIFNIGTLAQSSTRSFNGSIDDVRVYDRALGADDVNDLYNSYDSVLSSGGSGASGSVSLGKGLVGSWPFNGNAKDSTPYSNNGTVNGPTLTTDRLGRNNSAYSFNGSNQYISLPASDSLNSPTFSFSAWVYPTSDTADMCIIGSLGNGGSGGNGPEFERKSAGGIMLTQEDVVPIAGGAAPGNVPLDTWSQVGVTYAANGAFAFYVNGQMVGSGTNLVSFTFTNYGIGMYHSSINKHQWTGKIDDVRIYNRALSSDEMQALYNAYN